MEWSYIIPIDITTQGAETTFGNFLKSQDPFLSFSLDFCRAIADSVGKAWIADALADGERWIMTARSPDQALGERRLLIRCAPIAKLTSLPQAKEEVEQQGQNQAEEDAGDDGKVEAGWAVRGFFIDFDVSRQSARAGDPANEAE